MVYSRFFKAIERVTKVKTSIELRERPPGCMCTTWGAITGSKQKELSFFNRSWHEFRFWVRFHIQKTPGHHQSVSKKSKYYPALQFFYPAHILHIWTQ